jgi:branched-chain amino acid transport system substrate-binding protein
VAEGPAVEHALRSGVITVVVDRPPVGLLAKQNEAIAAGAAAATEEVNAAGGFAHHVHIKLVSQTLDGLSAAALRSRLSSEGAAVLILPCDTASQASLAAAGAQFGMLMLAPCSADASVGTRDPTYWSVGSSGADEATGLARFLGTHGPDRVFLVDTHGLQALETMTADFRSAAGPNGVTVVGSASVSTGASSFSNVVSAIEALRPLPPAVYSALPPPLVDGLAAALRSKGLATVVLGATVMDTPLTISAGAKEVENATFASYGFPREDAASRRYAADYRAQTGHEPEGSFPGLGFEAIRLLQAAAAKAGSAKPSAIQAALTAGIVLPGVALATRSYAQGGNHDPLTEVGVSKVAEGALLPLWATTPSAP